MQGPLYPEVMLAPASSAIAVICIAGWLYTLHKNISLDSIGFSYENVVQKKEYWRGITASFSHSGLLHLTFNMSSLWGCRYIEWEHGTTRYLAITILLLSLSLLGIIAAYHILIVYFRKENYIHQISVGYSCVVFGLMTILAQEGDQTSISLFGFPIRMSALPFVSLIITSFIIPNASFIGHLSGIISGYLISWGFFDWFTGYAFYCVLFWVIVFVAYSMKNSTTYILPSVNFVDLFPSNNSVRIENGVITRPRQGDSIV